MCVLIKWPIRLLDKMVDVFCWIKWMECFFYKMVVVVLVKMADEFLLDEMADELFV